MALGIKAAQQQGGQLQSTLDSEMLCNQLVIRALLCLLPSVPTGDEESAALVAVTLGRVMNNFRAWSVEKVVQSSVEVVVVAEAPRLILELLFSGLSTLVTLGPLGGDPAVADSLRDMNPEIGKVMEADREALVSGVSQLLMCLRYLAASGGRIVLEGAIFVWV